MIAFLGALREEVADIRRKMIKVETIRGADYQIYRGKYRGKDILLVETGIGREKAEAAAQVAIERFPISSLVSLGFAGALNRELKIGDVVVCATLHHTLQEKLEEEKMGPVKCDNSLVSLVTRTAPESRVKFYQGRGVTASEIAVTPEAKMKLGESFHAQVVDLESYWVGQIAAEQQIPFVAVRAVSDTTGDSLLPSDWLMSADAHPRWRKSLLPLLGHPGYWVKLPALYWHARKARKSLTTFAKYFVTNLDEKEMVK